MAVSRQDLVNWLQHQIAEQKRIDVATSGSSTYPDVPATSVSSKDTSSEPEVQLLLPIDAKKRGARVKQLLLDRGNTDNIRPSANFIDPYFSVRKGWAH